MQGTFKEFDLNLREFKVYKGTGADEHEMFDEEKKYSQYIDNFKSVINYTPISSILGNIPLL